MRYRCDVVDADVGIGYPIASVVDVSIRIESYRHRLRSVTECPRLTSGTRRQLDHRLGYASTDQNFCRCSGSLGDPTVPGLYFLY